MGIRQSSVIPEMDGKRKKHTVCLLQIHCKKVLPRQQPSLTHITQPAFRNWSTILKYICI